MMLRSCIAASLALFGLVACAPGATVGSPSAAVAPAGATVPVGVETITPTDMYARIAFLASDALQGRDTPSQGLEAAAAYLVSEYRRFGLEPAGENGTFYQRYPFPLRAMDTTAVHFGTVDASGRNNRMLAYGRDFYASAVANRAGTDMNHARLAYVGRLGDAGLPPGEYTGVLPVVMIPGDFSRDWRAEVTRARNAVERAGAAGLVVVLDPAFPEATFQRLAQQARQPQRGLPRPTEIPVFYLTERAARSVLQRGGLDLAAATAGNTASRVLPGVAAHFAATVQITDNRMPPNVVAVLKGSDPVLRDEYVILSSHMDHVGIGTPVNGDSIYNGADDDASGTAALVEIAEAMASLPVRPRRSVMFLNVSGEEKGLLGSRWYSDHPSVPLDRVVANINIDMIGRNAPDSVVVIGKNYSSLGQVVNSVGARHAELQLTVADDLWPQERFFFRSDHFNFARKEIPALFFFTGVHPDYHRPSDEVDKINTDKATRVTRLIYHTAMEIANAAARPVWDPKGLQEVRKLTQ